MTLVAGARASFLLARRASGRSLPLRSLSIVGQELKGRGFTQEKKQFSTTAGDALHAIASSNPHLEAIRYEYKNVKATYKKIDYWSDMLATGFVESGLTTGDVVLSWLPGHFVEQHVLQFACSKAGFTLYSLDPADTTDESAQQALGKALELTKANILVTQEAGQDRNYIRHVEWVVPEVTIFDFGHGMPFFSPRFPHLRFPVHTGFDNRDKHGMLPMRNFLCPSGELLSLLADNRPQDSTLLYGELILDSNGVPTKLGKTLSNKQVPSSGVWPVFSKMLKKEYQEVEGIGNVW